MTPLPVAARAGALGVGAEQGGLDPVRLRERRPDRVQQPGVGRGVAAPRAADRRLVDRDDPRVLRHRAVDQRALARPGDAGDHAQHAERDVHAHVPQVVPGRVADLQGPGRLAGVRLEGGPVAEVAPGERVAGPQAVDGPLEAHRAAVGARAGSEVDHVVGDRDHVRLVLDDQHGVALVPQPQQQPVHPLDVVRMQAHGGLVEDVGHVGEAGAQVADHLGALRLAARQRARRPVEAEVPEPDLDERVEGLPQRREQRRHRRLGDAAHPLREVADLHGAGIRDVDAVIRDDRAASLSRVPPHSGHAVNVTARSTNARMCGWSVSMSLDRNDFCTLGTSPS